MLQGVVLRGIIIIRKAGVSAASNRLHQPPSDQGDTRLWAAAAAPHPPHHYPPVSNITHTARATPAPPHPLTHTYLSASMNSLMKASYSGLSGRAWRRPR